jgi:DNA-directed RNA polymerase subunit M/transcription elongation factor TFIIS
MDKSKCPMCGTCIGNESQIDAEITKKKAEENNKRLEKQKKFPNIHWDDFFGLYWKQTVMMLDGLVLPTECPKCGKNDFAIQDRAVVQDTPLYACRDCGNVWE